MIDYLALAMEQERDEKEEDIGNDILYVPQTTQVKSGSPRIKNPPLPAPNQERDSAGLSPRLKTPRAGEDFRFPASRDAAYAAPYGAEEESGDGELEGFSSGVWTDGGFRQGQFPARRGKNLPLPAVSQYEAAGSFSAKAWPRGRAIFDSGGPVAAVGAAAGGFPSEWQDRDFAVLPLLRQVRQAQRESGFVQSQRRAFAVTLPESGPAAALSAEDFDLACERDARRYGGGFGLY